MSAKKSSTIKSAPKKTGKASSSHPTWIDMIKECIAANLEDARIGVSRPQIKKFVESKYKLEIGAAQVSQLSKAISSGAEKRIFNLPKGPSGRVKLAPKAKTADTSAKENKPAAKPASKAKVTAKVKPKAAAKPKATPKPKPKVVTKKVVPAAPKPRTTSTSRSAGAATTRKAAVVPRTRPAANKKAVPAKKVIAKPKTTPAKKTTAPSRRAPAKKAVTGSTPASKAKAAAKKVPVKRAAAKPAAKAPVKAASSRKKPAKRT